MSSLRQLCARPEAQRAIVNSGGVASLVAIARDAEVDLSAKRTAQQALKMLSINSIASTPYSADPLVTRSLSALCNNACRLLVENVDDLLRSAVHNGVQQNRRNSD